MFQFESRFIFIFLLHGESCSNFRQERLMAEAATNNPPLLLGTTFIMDEPLRALA
jgi:hypothetical protein